MQNQPAKIETLLEHAYTTLGQSMEKLREKYKGYPICLMEYIEKEVHEYVVEIRFDKEEATLSISFDSENNCDACFLFFDCTSDVELFINYLVDSADYNFRKSSFKLRTCSLKVKEIQMETCFYLFR